MKKLFFIFILTCLQIACKNESNKAADGTQIPINSGVPTAPKLDLPPNPDQEKLLSEAAKDNNLIEVKRLLALKINPNVPTVCGLGPVCERMPVCSAILNNNLEMIEVLYQAQSANCVFREETADSYAVHMQNYDLLALQIRYQRPYLDAKMPPLGAFYFGYSGYWWAIQHRDLRALKMLTDAKAVLVLDTPRDRMTSPLHEALALQDDEVTNLILKVPRVRQGYFLTPLTSAFYFYNRTAILTLLQQGDRIVPDSSYMWLPYGTIPPTSFLAMAIEKNDTEIVDLLLAHGADPSGKPFRGLSPLMMAAQKNQIETIQKLLSRQVKIDEAITLGNLANNTRGTCEDELGYQAIHIAAKSGSVDAIETLLKAGASLDVLSDCRETPLGVAARFNKTEAAKYLLQRGADANHLNHYVRCPLTSSIDSEECYTYVVLENSTPLLDALQNSNIELVQALLDHGADPNRVAFFGRINFRAPLFVALDSGVTQNIELVVNKGADLSLCDNEGDGILHKLGKLDAAHADWLLRKIQLPIAEYSRKNRLGMAPLHKLFLFGGKDSDIAHIIQLLLSYGADINTATANKAITPLMYAAGAYNQAFPLSVDVLMSAGANASLRSSEKKAALDYAKEKSFQNIVDIICSHQPALCSGGLK